MGLNISHKLINNNIFSLLFLISVGLVSLISEYQLTVIIHWGTRLINRDFALKNQFALFTKMYRTIQI